MSEDNEDAQEIEAVLSRHGYRMLASGIAPIELDWARQKSFTTWMQWYEHWTDRAETYSELGESATANSRHLTGANHFLSASLCYQFSQFMMYDEVKQKELATQQSAIAFRKAAPNLRPLVEVFTATGKHNELEHPAPVTLSMPQGAGPHPCVLMIPGLEANKTEMQGWQRYYTERSLAFASLEGPGQGELAHVPLDLDTFIATIRAAVDVLEDRPDIDPSKIGICGVSLGGLLASLAVAHDQRFKAGGEAGGTFDTVSRWERANSLSKRGHQHITQSKDEQETYEKIKTWTLRPVVNNISCPFLVVHGEQDTIVPVDQAEMFRKYISQAELIVVPNGNHVCNNLSHVFRPIMADWFANALNAP